MPDPLEAAPPPALPAGWTDADLTAAFQAVIASYGNAPSDAPPSASGVPAAATGPGGAVWQYLARRDSWEIRQAREIVNSMNRRAQLAQAVEPAAEQCAGGHARRRALLVDDVSDVLVIVSAFLASFGFDVVRASTGDEALGILAGDPGIALLVTDHAMPGMSGTDLAREARQQWPGLQVLIITGYPDLAELGALPEGVLLLAKPFRRADLEAKVGRLCNATAAAGAEPSVNA